MKMYKLYQKGYEPYIDFLKGYLILCILFTHACQVRESLRDYLLYVLWGCAPTGCFMMISTMHIFRNGLGEAKFHIWKHFRKVILPYLVIQSLIVVAVIIMKSPQYYNYDKIESLIISGGYGAGSYFPWVYMQYLLLMSVLLPVIRTITNMKLLCVFFILFSVVIEILCNIYNIDDKLYRILVCRYPFLIYLGIIIDKEGIYLSRKRVLFSIISFIFIIAFTYGEFHLEPLFYNTNWRTYHWICYPYLAFILLYFVFYIYDKTKGSKVSGLMIRIGRASYGIFLVQALWFSLAIYPESDFSLILYIFGSMILCSFIGVQFKEKILDYFFGN